MGRSLLAPSDKAMAVRADHTLHHRVGGAAAAMTRPRSSLLVTSVTCRGRWFESDRALPGSGPSVDLGKRAPAALQALVVGTAASALQALRAPVC